MEPMDDYKAYSLGRLTEWLHDCMSAAEASPKEIYDTIVETVREQYYYYKNGASKTSELLQLLNGFDAFPLHKYVEKKSWILPTEVDGLTGDVFVKLPDDLLEAADLKEGDTVNWIDKGDGSWIMSKVKDNETT